MCCEDEDDGVDDNGAEDDEGLGEVVAGTSDNNTSSNDTYICDPSLASLKELVDLHGLDVLYPPVDGTAFYSTICRVNHSCDPNVRVIYKVTPQLGLQAYLTAIKPIVSGEELVQSYIDQFLPYQDRQQALEDYGFRCSCAKCSSESNS